MPLHFVAGVPHRLHSAGCCGHVPVFLLHGRNPARRDLVLLRQGVCLAFRSQTLIWYDGNKLDKYLYPQ